MGVFSTAAVVGGDQRQHLLAFILAAKGVRVRVFGLHMQPVTGIRCVDTLDEIEDAEAVFLPIPYRNAQGLIATDHGGLPVEQLGRHLQKDGHVFLGRGDIVSNQWQDNGIRVVDLLMREDFQVWNAVPSAEGAIHLAMANADVTLWRSHCLVLGYGRIGKVLADRLSHLGAIVTVEARKPEDIARIEADGHSAVALPKLPEALPNQRFIFNTVPHLILDRPALACVDKESLIIDLASLPGGVDFDTAQEMGITARLELGLPGRLSPRTAAEIVLQAAEAAW